MFFFSVAIHNINKLHTQGKKNMCTEKLHLITRPD